jgi:hypothetical protein
MQSMTTRIQASRAVFHRWAGAVAVMLLAALAVALLTGDVEILKRTVAPGGSSEIQPFIDAVDDVKGPATLALMTIVPVGVIVGGGMMATGSRKGVQVMAASCGAGALVLLGNGLVA